MQQSPSSQSKFGAGRARRFRKMNAGQYAELIEENRQPFIATIDRQPGVFFVQLSNGEELPARGRPLTKKWRDRRILGVLSTAGREARDAQHRCAARVVLPMPPNAHSYATARLPSHPATATAAVPE